MIIRPRKTHTSTPMVRLIEQDEPFSVMQVAVVDATYPMVNDNPIGYDQTDVPPMRVIVNGNGSLASRMLPQPLLEIVETIDWFSRP